MKTAIIGGGSLGLLWSARLAMADLSVTLLTRTAAQASLINKTGIILQPLSGTEKVVPVEACATEDYLGERVDWLFVMVKQLDLPQLLPTIQALVHRRTQVLFWQNGWGHGEVVKTVSTMADTNLAVTTEGALRQAMNRVKHTGEGITWLGSYPQSLPLVPPPLRPLLQLNKKIVWEQEILVRIWEKLAINCVINPLTALAGIPNGEIADSRYDKIKEAMIEELVCVAQKEGIALDSLVLREKVEQVIRLTAGNQSSMLQDLKRGRKTEIDYINGVIVKLGRKWSLSTPTHAELVERVHAKEAQNGSRE